MWYGLLMPLGVSVLVKVAVARVLPGYSEVGNTEKDSQCDFMMKVKGMSSKICF